MLTQNGDTYHKTLSLMFHYKHYFVFQTIQYDFFNAMILLSYCGVRTIMVSVSSMCFGVLLWFYEFY